jgi:hypothetical protein
MLFVRVVSLHCGIVVVDGAVNGATPTCHQMGRVLDLGATPPKQ